MYLKKKEPPFVSMQRLLLGYGLKASKLANVLQVSEPTAKKKLDDPKRFTLDDLDRINRFGHVPIEELREAVSR